MTLLERLASISRSFPSNLDNLNYINVACSFFINTLPNQLSRDFYIEEEVSDGNGIACGLKYDSVIRDTVPCRRIPLNLKRRINVVNSEFSVSVEDPVFYKENSKIFIKPDPTVDEKGYVMKIPSVFIPDGASTDIEDIPNVPKESENIILIYAGFLIVSKLLRDLSFPEFPTFNDTQNEYTISFPVIGDITVDTTLDFTDLDALSYTDVDQSEFNLDPSEITKGLAALENAFKFVGSLTEDAGGPDNPYSPTGVPTGAFWLDDEDPEMVQSASQLAAQEVNRANSYFGNRSTGLNTFRTVVDGKVAEFSAKVNVQIQKIRARIDRMQVEAQAKGLLLQKHGLEIQEVQTELQKFQIDIQQRLQQNQQLLERFGQQVQSYQVEYTTLTQEAVSLFERYKVELLNYLGVNDSK
jgi:hypothetical protein